MRALATSSVLMAWQALSSGCVQSDCILYPDLEHPDMKQCSWVKLQPDEIFWPSATTANVGIDEPLLIDRLNEGAVADLRVRQGHGEPMSLIGCGAQLKKRIDSLDPFQQFQLTLPALPALSKYIGDAVLEISAEGRGGRSKISLRGPYDQPGQEVTIPPQDQKSLSRVLFSPSGPGRQLAMIHGKTEQMPPYTQSWDVGLCILSPWAGGIYGCSPTAVPADLRSQLVGGKLLAAASPGALLVAAVDIDGTRIIRLRDEGTDKPFPVLQSFFAERLAVDSKGESVLLIGPAGIDGRMEARQIYQGQSWPIELNAPGQGDFLSGLRAIAVGDVDGDGQAEDIILHDRSSTPRIEVLRAAASGSGIQWSWDQGRSDMLSALLEQRPQGFLEVDMTVFDLDGDQSNDILILGTLPGKQPASPKQWALVVLRADRGPCPQPLMSITLSRSALYENRELLELSIGSTGDTGTTDLLITAGKRSASGLLSEDRGLLIYRYKAQ